MDVVDGEGTLLEQPQKSPHSAADKVHDGSPSYRIVVVLIMDSVPISSSLTPALQSTHSLHLTLHMGGPARQRSSGSKSESEIRAPSLQAATGAFQQQGKHDVIVTARSLPC